MIIVIFAALQEKNFKYRVGQHYFVLILYKNLTKLLQNSFYCKYHMKLL